MEVTKIDPAKSNGEIDRLTDCLKLLDYRSSLVMTEEEHLQFRWDLYEAVCSASLPEVVIEAIKRVPTKSNGEPFLYDVYEFQTELAKWKKRNERLVDELEAAGKDVPRHFRTLIAEAKAEYLALPFTRRGDVRTPEDLAELQSMRYYSACGVLAVAIEQIKHQIIEFCEEWVIDEEVKVKLDQLRQFIDTL